MQEQTKKKCFVVMGFGEKTDYATSRLLDLDKTYRLIIKKAVEDAGLECIRADEITHAGIIDIPMYELLYEADVVVADLSTANANAIYELGVRHALRPNTTIVIAEKQFKFPFDVNHLVIRPYEHLGKGIDGEEAERAREELKDAIMKLVNGSDVDSPVYTFLPQLKMPVLGIIAKAASVTETAAEVTKEDGSASMLMDMFKDARKSEDWMMALSFLKKLLDKMPTDIYLLQQLAFCTYQSKQPNAGDALDSAKAILEKLNPHNTADPETLGLWGAVHKRLWESRQNRADLDESIKAYEKGFYLKNDYYNGINYAYQLNARAAVSDKRDAIADYVYAERVRKSVIEICNGILNPGKNKSVTPEFIEDKAGQFWMQASLVEAYFGIGDTAKAEELKKTLSDIAPENWMMGSLNNQLEKLAKLMEKTSVAV